MNLTKLSSYHHKKCITLQCTLTCTTISVSSGIISEQIHLWLYVFLGKWLIPAWIVTELSIFVPAFFVIMYSMDWGAAKANAWLIAYVMSFFETVLITDPVKVRISFEV